VQARLAAGPRERPERWRRPTDLKADKVLQAIGFAPNVDGYGLEAAGVTLTDRKAIGIDDYMRTNVPHIYAIGDATGLLQLAHVAEAQGGGRRNHRRCKDFGTRRLPDDAAGDVLPAAGCQLRADRGAGPRRGLRRQGRQVPVDRHAKAHGLGDPSGFVKLIADGKYGELLGGHLIGHDVSELLPKLALAQKWDPSPSWPATCTPNPRCRRHCRNASMAWPAT
jgi:dihydrolipoamide dehydrogenase